ncbi:unnamed protein product [Linum trigynum]|uniref:Uncharacterized protein n=1 Tax=Linum trigynum TaxID=586398 RepID=A0AAV2CSA1_9ROSI
MCNGQKIREGKAYFFGGFCSLRLRQLQMLVLRQLQRSSLAGQRRIQAPLETAGTHGGRRRLPAAGDCWRRWRVEKSPPLPGSCSQ